MKTLSNNDTWILRTLIKLNDYLKAEHENFYDDMIALRFHINKMTYLNRKTGLRDIYVLLRSVSQEYQKGAESFSEFMVTSELNKTVKKLMRNYKPEIAEASKDSAA